MTNKADESFSAFLDGEASELDVQRMLKRLSESPGDVSHWHEMSKVQAVFNGDVVVDSALTITKTDAKSSASKKHRFMTKKSVQGSLVAAFALVVMTSFGIMTREEPSLLVSDASEVSESSQVLALAQQSFVVQQRLGVYMREHAEQASYTTGHVVVPADLVWVEASP